MRIQVLPEARPCFLCSRVAGPRRKTDTIPGRPQQFGDSNQRSQEVAWRGAGGEGCNKLVGSNDKEHLPFQPLGFGFCMLFCIQNAGRAPKNLNVSTHLSVGAVDGHRGE